MACIEVENQVQTWCEIMSFPSVILRPGPRVGGGGVDVSKRGVGLVIPYIKHVSTASITFSEPGIKALARILSSYVG